MSQNKDEMSTMPVRQLLMKLAIPTVIASLVNLLYNIVDRIYIGHIPGIGASALTGAGLFMPILLLINSFAALVCSGGAPLAGIAMGGGHHRKAARILSNCFTLILILSVILTFVFYASAPALLRFFGASDDTLPYALPYSRIYILGTVFVMIAYGMNLFISAQGFSKTAMLSVTIGALINIALDPLLMFVFDMGVEGAAIATDISQAVSCVWILCFLFGTKTRIAIQREYMKLEKDIFLPCLQLGLSTFIMISTESLLSISFNHSLAQYGGDMAVGAMTIITSLSSLISMPLHGLCQGGTPIISYNYGAGKTDRVKEAFREMITAAVILCMTFWCLTMFTPKVMASIFTTDEALISYAVRCMHIYFAVIFTTAFQTVCQQSFVALGQAKISIFLACLRKLILLIPLIFILPLFISDKVFAVFLAEPLSDFIAASITAYCFLRFLKNLRPDQETSASQAVKQ